MLRHVGCCCLRFENGQILANNTQHVATCCNRVAKRTQHVAPNNVAICCVGMLRSFGRGFTLKTLMKRHRVLCDEQNVNNSLRIQIKRRRYPGFLPGVYKTWTGSDRIGLTKPGLDRIGLTKPGSDCVRLTKPGPDPKKTGSP